MIVSMYGIELIIQKYCNELEFFLYNSLVLSNFNIDFFFILVLHALLRKLIDILKMKAMTCRTFMSKKNSCMISYLPIRL